MRVQRYFTHESYRGSRVRGASQRGMSFSGLQNPRVASRNREGTQFRIEARFRLPSSAAEAEDSDISFSAKDYFNPDFDPYKGRDWGFV